MTKTPARAKNCDETLRVTRSAKVKSHTIQRVKLQHTPTVMAAIIHQDKQLELHTQDEKKTSSSPKFTT